MPLPLSHKKERLSVAVIRAIVANSGHAIQINESDYGVDGRVDHVKHEGQQYYQDGPFFSFQLKSSWLSEIRGEKIIYDLEADAYNRCVKYKGFPPMVLIVFHMPQDTNRWVYSEEDHMMMRHCPYWTFMEGEPTNATSRKRIKIPRVQVFNEKAVDHILSMFQGSYRK